MGYMPDVRVEVAFNSGVLTLAADRTWTDVSDYVEFTDGITISRGRANELATTSPSTMSLTFDNSDGRFTPGRAASPYYPNVKIGRPIRVRVNHLTNGNRGTFDTDATGWSGSSCTVARVTTPTQAGAGALSMTATAATTIAANAGPLSVDADVVAPGETYSAEAYVRRDGVTARNGDMAIDWLDAAGVTITSINGTDVALTTSYQLLTVSGVAPATAAFCRVRARVLAAGIGEVFHVDTAALFSDRFTGYVDEWPVEWPAGVDGVSQSSVTASGRLARVGEGAELRSIVETEIMADSPIAYYPLGEPEIALFAQEFTGSDTIGMFSYFGGPGITFGTGTGPGTDGLPAARVKPVLDAAEDGRYLAAHFNHSSMTQLSMEVFVANGENESPASTFVELGTASTNDDYTIFQITGASNVVDVAGAGYQEKRGGVIASISSFVSYPGLYSGTTHHLAVTYDPSPLELKFYINGALVGTETTESVFDPGTLSTVIPEDWILVAGATRVASGTEPTTVSHVVVYDQVLSADRILAHADSGLNGFEGELAGERIERYANYANIEAAQVASDPGVVPLIHIDTTNQTVDSLLRTIETTENGVLHDGRDGTIVFRDRTHRYQAATAFTLDAAEQEVGDGMRPVLDRSTLINEVTAKSTDGTLQQRYPSTAAELLAAQEETGPARVDLEIASNDVDVLYQSGAWRVNNYKEPLARIGSLAPVDVLPLSADLRAAIVAADISSRFAVDNLPTQAPDDSTAFFIEGVTETLSLESWRFEFNVSPSAPYDNVWVLDSATHSQLDSTTILAL